MTGIMSDFIQASEAEGRKQGKKGGKGVTFITESLQGTSINDETPDGTPVRGLGQVDRLSLAMLESGRWFVEHEEGSTQLSVEVDFAEFHILSVVLRKRSQGIIRARRIVVPFACIETLENAMGRIKVSVRLTAPDAAREGVVPQLKFFSKEGAGWEPCDDFTQSVSYTKVIALQFPSSADRERLWKRLHSHPATSAAINGSLYSEYAIPPGPLLGEGSFAKVWKGFRKLDSEECAVKIIDKKKISMPKLVAAQKKEWEILHSLNHPNIIKVYSFYECDATMSIVMEVCHGGDLQALLEAGEVCIDERFTRHVMAQLLSALVYLHDRKISHRDVKLENVLFKQVVDPKHPLNSLIKLSDFGTAKTSGGVTFIGTSFYLAPEVIQVGCSLKDGSYTFSCDMWSCGVVLYVLLSGELPFDSAKGKSDEVMKKILSGRYSTSKGNWKN
eukprot:CAMPEP_0119141380 /NCGR_PEP_ID=MMETSP1310-20130426/30942_1 /TAXON_ID=464262 /ORGANISM="Genus nov. species nov., Strain RCC2339" /LENGTH=444 /DNA_ID=CAMNT_0007132831 /DNA_START=5 /DNA_END=1336 /DNA_ORIENTATION=-